MDNSYFKLLASKPIVRSGNKSASSKKWTSGNNTQTATVEDASRKQQMHETKPSKKRKFRANRRRVSDESEPERKSKSKNMYRDRVKERLRGVNPDYEGVQNTIRDVSIEHSKFLGGDMKHTHLVKGLDFALLHKVRREINESGSSAKAQETAKSQTKKPVFKTRRAAAIYQEMIERTARKSRSNAQFAQGYMTYKFNVDVDAHLTDETSRSDLPSIVRREGVWDSTIVKASVDVRTIELLKQLESKKSSHEPLVRERTNAGRMCSEEKTLLPPKIKAQAIFEDAGKYVPPHSRGDFGGV